MEPKGETGLVEALHTVAEKVKQRALIVVLSDLFCDPEALGDALQHLRYRKHDIALFHLLDRQEIDFAFDRPHRFVDLEDNSTLVAEPNLIEDEYKAALNEYLTIVEAKAHDVQADYQQIVTDQDYEAILSDFLTNRLR